MNPMNDVQDILRTTEHYREFWQPRNTRIREWLDLELMVNKNAATDKESYISNEPMTMMTLAIHILTGNPLSHRVITTNQADSKKAGESERFLTSIWRDISERHTLAGNGISWDKAFAYWMSLTGWYAVAARTESDVANNPVFIADLLNPMNVYPQYTSQHTQAVAHYYSTNQQDALEKAELWGTKISLDGKDFDRVTIIDYWWKPSLTANAHNAVLIRGVRSAYNQGEFLLSPHESPYLDIPILVGPVGGIPFRGTWDEDDRTWQESAGRSILEPTRQTITQFNRWMSFLAELARQSAQSPIFVSGIQLNQQQLKRPMRDGSAIISTQNKDATAHRLDPGRFPVETQTIANILQGEMQRGGFPYVLYGGATIDLSGFAINQLLNAATKLIGAQKDAFSRVVAQIDKIFLESYRKYNYNNITISGKTTDRRPDWFMEEFSADRIPDKIFVEAEVSLTLPSDMLNRITILRQALGNNLPILDLLTGLEDILRLDDPYGVMERIKQDQAQMSVEAQKVRLWQGMMQNAKDLRAVGGPDNTKAATMLEQLADFIVSQQSPTSQLGAQQRTSGLPPELQSPEASGRSPDVMRSLLGLPPAGANR